MTDARTIFSLSLRDQATSQLKQFEGNFKRSVGNIESESGDYANLAAGVSSVDGALTMLGATAPQVALAMAAVGVAATAIDWSRQAAEVQAIEASFNRLAASVGSSGASMLAAMQNVSSGMISDQDLMLAANSAMALGVADNAQEIASLLEVAIAKGAEFGIEPTKAFADLVNGLGRMSPEILNNIGVVIDAQQAYAQYAQSIGTTVDKLSQQQRMQALVNAVLAANPDAAAQAAAAGDSAAAAFARWDVATRQFSEAFGAVFLPAIAAGLDLVTQFINAVGGIGDVLAGKIDMTPEEIDAQIVTKQAQIDDYETPGKYADASYEVARLRDEIAMLEQAKRMLSGTATATATNVQGVGTAAGFAAGSMGQASASSSTLTQKLAALAGQADVTRDALKSAWISAAGALGSAQAYTGWKEQEKQLAALSQAWNYAGMTGEQKIFEESAFLAKNNDLIQQQIQLIDEATRSQANYGSSVGSTASAYDGLLGKVQSMLQGALSPDVSILGGAPSREDDINENARRLAAIANEGIADQSWMEEFKREVPGIFEEIVSAADPQAAAARIFQEFQAGLRPELIDKELVKERIKAAITGEQEMSALASEIAAELAAEMGVSLPEALSAAQSALGVNGLPGGQALAASLGGMDASQSGSQAGGSFSGGFVAGFSTEGMALQVLAKIDGEFAKGDNLEALRTSGGAVGAVWGEGFMATVGNNIPLGLLDILLAHLLPAILAAIAQQGSMTAPDA